MSQEKIVLPLILFNLLPYAYNTKKIIKKNEE